MKPQRNILLTFAYDGTAYCGWQKQKDKPSIQSVAEKALEEILKEKITLTGSGRTDSGVHAFAHPANFFTGSLIRCENLIKALNSVLPPDIRVTSACEKDNSFSARYSARKKHYRYSLYNHEIASPFQYRYSLFHPRNLDLRLLRRSVKYLQGEHDFTSFCSIKDESGSRIRRIDSVRVFRNGSVVNIDFKGSGFLYNMIRIIVGTLLEINKDKLPPKHMLQILNKRDREAAGPTAQPHGLCLMKVWY